METKTAAKILYMEGMAQKEIAKLLGTTETTIGAWKKDGAWESERTRKNLLSMTNSETMEELIHYQQQTLLAQIKEWKENNTGKLISKGDVDALSKLYSTIKKKDTVWADYVKIIREFTQHIAEVNPSLAKEVIGVANDFINHKREAL
jgi:uncharacterized protein YjcR